MTGRAKVPVPIFAFVFLGLCVVNSLVPSMAALVPIYAPVKAWLLEISFWGLMIAIGALGLGTSITAISALGWRHVAIVSCTTVVIFAIVTAGLLMMG
jgi:uncharacterized membrane protein YadS